MRSKSLSIFVYSAPTDPSPRGASQTSVWRRNRRPRPCGLPGAGYRPLRPAIPCPRREPSTKVWLMTAMPSCSGKVTSASSFPVSSVAKIRPDSLRNSIIITSDLSVAKKLGNSNSHVPAASAEHGCADSFKAPSPFPAFPVPLAWFYQRRGHRYPVWYWAGNAPAAPPRCGHPRPGQ